MNTVDQKKIVPIFNVADYVAGVNSTSINMSNYSHATIILLFDGTVSGNARMTISSAAATDTSTTAITDWKGWVTGADVGAVASDTFSATAVTVDSAQNYCTLTEATFEDRMLVIEIPASLLADGHNWFRIVLGAEAASGGLHGVAILTPRYAQKDIPTAVKTA